VAALPSLGVLLLEFAAQGVRGVVPAGGRAALRPGYNVVAAEGGPLRRLLEALLVPDSREVEALTRAAGPGGGTVRAGLTLVGTDRVTYRLVRDFAAGCQLHRFDPEKRAFALVSQDLAEIGAFLRQPVGVPTPGRLATLLTIAAAELPSKAGGGPVAGLASTLAPARAALSPEQARKRLAELEAELARAGAAEKLQYRLDGLQSRLFKLEEALKSGQRLRDGLAAAEAERAALEPVAQVAAGLGDPAARLAAADKARARHDEAMARVAAERAGLDEADARGAPQPLWQDPVLWGCLAAGAAFLTLGLVGAGMGSDLRYLALLDLPAFAGAGWVAHRWIGGLEAWERQGRRRKIIDDWEHKVLDQVSRDTADVTGAAQALGLQGTKELREALARLDEAEAAVADWRARLAAWQGDAQTSDALAEKGRVEEELRVVEGQLSGEVGGFVRDVRTVEMEIDRTRAEAEAPEAPVAAATVPAPAPATAGPAGDPLRGLLERAAAELGGSPAAVARSIATKASQALAGLTLNRLTGLTADDRGNVQVAMGGRPSPALTLPPADRDLVWVALKLALLEQAVTSGKAVGLVEDAFGGLSDGTRRTIGRLLKQVAKGGQVIHGTSDPAFREAADHQA
jgi:hypothetical protein